jgi:hypothetical protein
MLVSCAGEILCICTSICFETCMCLLVNSQKSYVALNSYVGFHVGLCHPVAQRSIQLMCCSAGVRMSSSWADVHVWHMPVCIPWTGNATGMCVPHLSHGCAELHERKKGYSCCVKHLEVVVPGCFHTQTCSDCMQHATGCHALHPSQASQVTVRSLMP